MDIKSLTLSRLAYIKEVCGDLELRRQIIKIPKYELHVHLGGSIRRSTIVELAKKNSVPLPASKKDFIKAMTPLEFFRGDNLWELFHNTYMWHWSCVRSCDDLERIVFEFLEDSAEQGVVHSEITVSGTYLMNTFPFDEWVNASSCGIARAERAYGISGGIILDISRRSGPEKALEKVLMLAESGSDCLCGIGMGGDEVKHPYHLFKEAFSVARKKGIPSTIHVSEFLDGNATIGVIKELKPDRIGHALTTLSSPEAYDLLKSSGVHVETLPLCNYMGGMGGIDDISKHPICRYYKDGVSLSINSDDPQILGFDLLDCYVFLMKEAGFILDDYDKINRSASENVFVKGV